MDDRNAIPEQGFLKFTVSMLPNKLKRLLLLTSLAAVVKDIKDSDQETIHLINKVLHLAVKDTALVFPIRVKSFIWSDFQVIAEPVRRLSAQRCTPAMGSLYAKSIIDRIPDWFSYAPKTEMVDDVVSLFQITSISALDPLVEEACH